MRKSVCKRGHSLTDPANIGIRPSNGKRYCKACNYLKLKEWRLKGQRMTIAQTELLLLLAEDYLGYFIHRSEKHEIVKALIKKIRTELKEAKEKEKGG